MAVLTATTGLLDQLAFAIGWDGECFAISDLWLAGGGFDFVLALEAVAENFEMQLAHAGDDDLAGFFVGLDEESRVFFGEALEGIAHLFLIALRLWLDGHGDHGFWERWRLKENVEIFITEGVASANVLHAHEGCDVT